MEEEWKDIKNYEGYYQVSNKGRVKSLHHYASNGYKDILYKGKVLKPGNNGRGYLFVNLCKNNKTKQFYIHKLVAEAFIQNKENKATVNHIDGIKSNNNVENLEWNTYSENNTHMHRVLGVNTRDTSKNKITQQYDTNGNLIKEYKSMREAQRQTGILSIDKVCNGKRKTAGGFIWKYKNQ